MTVVLPATHKIYVFLECKVEIMYSLTSKVAPPSQ